MPVIHIWPPVAPPLANRRAGRRRAVERPLRLARLGIERLQHARQIVEVAGDADQHVIADDERRVRRPVAALRVGDLDIPFHLAVFRVQRDQVRVGRSQEDRSPYRRRRRDGRCESRDSWDRYSATTASPMRASIAQMLSGA